MDILNLKKPNRIIKALQNIGFYNQSNLFWSWYEPRNFGDWVGPYLYKAMTGKKPLYCEPTMKPGCEYYMAAGSILRKITQENNAIVWGSGIISRNDVFAKPLDIKAVRGPYSMQRCLDLGYDCPEVFGDPALLLPEYYAPEAVKVYRLGIIPHFVDYDDVVKKYGSQPDTLIIDVAQPVEKVIDDIRSCDATVSSSLHGLIISHVYGIDCAWVQFSDRLEGDDTKFLDYLAAGGIVEKISAQIPTVTTNSVDFLHMAHDAPMPDNNKLTYALKRACPF